jgi:hypothetical protein
VLVGALVAGVPLRAQERPAPPREVPADSASLPDSLRPPAVPLPSDTLPPRDTIKTAFAAAERPRGAELRGRQYVWTRETIFVSGAQNLAELVAEVPGASIVRSGYLMAPIVTSWYGEPGRVRVFFDGVELDALDARMAGQLDLASIPLYGLEEVAVERVASELRVFLRTWRVEQTTPSTRVDVGTGAENFTLYRGYYARRFDNGGGLQVAAQQFSVINGLTRGDGDSFGGIARLGWAGGDWSVDAVGMSSGRNRAPTRRYVRATPDDAAMARFEGSERLGYLRVGYRQPDADGLWAQAIAATQAYLEDDSLAASAMTPDPDTLRSQSQYVLTGGWTQGALRLSGAARYRVRGGAARLAPSLRATYDRPRLSLGAFAELDGPDSTRRVDLTARALPLSWLSVGVSAGQQDPATGGGPSRTALQAEVGLEWTGRFVRAGVIQRSEAQVAGLGVYDPLYGPAVVPESQGLMLAIGGPVWGPFSLDLSGIDWGDEQLYRPRHQARSVLRVQTALRRWLTRDTFLLTGQFIHDYRSDLLAPDGLGGTVRAKGAGVLSMLLDIRLGSAHIFFHNRNFTGQVYETVPGYLMPRLIQQYGVRWEFWN